MWFEETGEVLEMFRSSFPFSILFFVPIFIIISPVGPVGAAHEFAVYRMQQYDLHGSGYGCKNALVNVEARPIDAQVLTRRCSIAKLREFTIDKFKEMASQNAGGLLILLPQNFDELSVEDKKHLLEIEQDLLEEETAVPVYFTHETPELESIYQDVRASANTDQAGSAVEALFGSITANGFQLVVNGPQSKALPDFQITNIQGKLSGYGIEEQLPTVAVVAHYDAFGVAPSLAFGADSNGSGVASLLELARIFSKLYTNSRTHAKFNIIFLLSGGGKFNYQGTKKWIEDNLDGTESSLLPDVNFVLCLDSVGSGDKLHLHVSKPPKEGSAGDKFLKNLQDVSEVLNEKQVEVKHKKINLAEDLLAWEHERFSIRRLPAFTLSGLESPKVLERNTIADTTNQVDIKKLTKNTKVLAEALARYIYNLSSEEDMHIFTGNMDVQESLLSLWLSYLTSEPRGAQLLDKDSLIVNTLEQGMSRHLKDVRKTYAKAEKRDPDFMFYSGSKFTMHAYNVKPAIFDLFLALGVAAYLSLIYLLGQNFSKVVSLLQRNVGGKTMVKNGNAKQS